MSNTTITQSPAEMKAELERLRAENEKLHGKLNPKMTFKVSEKGAISIYGLGRFPVTLYNAQMIRLLDKAADIRAFIEEHRAELTTK